MFKKIKRLFFKEHNIEDKKEVVEHKEELSDFINKAKGSIYGLAIGDALGAPLEFQKIKEGEGISGYVSGGVHKVRVGEFTDDTSMTLALMDSLVNNGFDLTDQANKYLNWKEKGDYSSRGYCFDIGITTVKALEKYKITKNPMSGGTEYYHSGNGSLMRLAPVPLLYYKDGLSEMVIKSIESSMTTHQSEIVFDTLKYFVVIYEKILSGEKDKSKLLKLNDDELLKHNIKEKTVLELLHEFDYENAEFEDIRSEGFVIYSTIASLYSLYKSNSFEEAILMAVNFGGDADTNGAITGQLAGAYYGYQSIPEKYLNQLDPKELIDQYATPFIELLKKQEEQP